VVRWGQRGVRGVSGGGSFLLVSFDPITHYARDLTTVCVALDFRQHTFHHTGGVRMGSGEGDNERVKRDPEGLKRGQTAAL
jgi:hypothetical protein